ncbi:YceI family protein [Chitinophaga pinensis]|uniref:YceI family protein n=1 Tax=Chitinophaga pinensis (strain ATCC 43595 / DSM 2588 / LMG 13176 / NBRC 15968 / NCIMB 11800 / UQM 2034) TaxID=485918 RepID=A0A979G2Z3_CHIPD|nr:YceI family protein [Chitinophaga pinensis]ACU59805.1 YceI family protein [Chitinophaga pinensis DSM 2588]
MKRVLYPLAFALVLFASAFTFVSSQNWKIAEGYSIKFSGSGANGIFKDLKGQVVFDEKNPAASKFDVTIAVSSINTGNGLKNTHAKGGKWFDASKFPTIHFVSSKVTKTATGYDAQGELEMHGVKKPFTIPFTFAKNGNGGTFTGNFDVNRVDFGIGEAGGRVDDVFKLQVSVPVTQ